MQALFLLIPLAFAILRGVTRQYVFSALTTLSCAALAAPRAPLMAAALAVSALGDWFMAHKGANQRLYRMGILFFLLAHILFIVYALTRARLRPLPLVLGAALAVGYALYLRGRVLPRVPALLKLPAALYTAVSVLGFTAALMTGDAAYIAGIGLLLFSDTMIAENDFLHHRACGALILPTYYLCQMLAVLSAMR